MVPCLLYCRALGGMLTRSARMFFLTKVSRRQPKKRKTHLSAGIYHILPILIPTFGTLLKISIPPAPKPPTSSRSFFCPSTHPMNRSLSTAFLYASYHFFTVLLFRQKIIWAAGQIWARGGKFSGRGPKGFFAKPKTSSFLLTNRPTG